MVKLPNFLGRPSSNELNDKKHKKRINYTAAPSLISISANEAAERFNKNKFENVNRLDNSSESSDGGSINMHRGVSFASKIKDKQLSNAFVDPVKMNLMSPSKLPKNLLKPKYRITSNDREASYDTPASSESDFYVGTRSCNTISFQCMSAKEAAFRFAQNYPNSEAPIRMINAYNRKENEERIRVPKGNGRMPSYTESIRVAKENNPMSSQIF